MIVGAGRQAELREDAGHVLLDRAQGHEHPIGDRLVRAALCHQLEDFALTRRDLVERVVLALPPEQPADDLGIERRAAVGNSPDGGAELVQVGDAILEEVADTFCASGEKLERVARLDVLREDENPGPGNR